MCVEAELWGHEVGARTYGWPLPFGGVRSEGMAAIGCRVYEFDIKSVNGITNNCIDSRYYYSKYS